MQEIKGTLFIVATPIGNLRDMSFRAVDVLSKVHRIYAEDTRNSIKLLHHYDINNQLVALHDHNEEHKVNELALLLEEGNDLALISDAGTPLISDPGYKVVRALGEQGVNIVSVPGPSAMIAALSIAGIPTDKFTFEGFLPAKKQARLQALENNLKQTYTQVYYESSHRIIACIEAMIEVMDEGRGVALARELTKVYEQVFRGNLGELLDWLKADRNHQKGEFVLVLAGFDGDASLTGSAMDQEQLVKILVSELPVKQAASIASKISGLSKNEAYQLALLIKKEQK